MHNLSQAMLLSDWQRDQRNTLHCLSGFEAHPDWADAVVPDRVEIYKHVRGQLKEPIVEFAGALIDGSQYLIFIAPHPANALDYDCWILKMEDIRTPSFHPISVVIEQESLFSMQDAQTHQVVCQKILTRFEVLDAKGEKIPQKHAYLRFYPDILQPLVSKQSLQDSLPNAEAGAHSKTRL